MHKGQWFTNELVQQLQPIFGKLNHDIILHQLTDASEKSHELSSFLTEFSQLSPHMTLQIEAATDEMLDKWHVTHLPNFSLVSADGQPTGIKFSGIPTGHELNSLVLAVYNMAGQDRQLIHNLLNVLSICQKTQIENWHIIDLPFLSRHCGCLPAHCCN